MEEELSKKYDLSVEDIKDFYKVIYNDDNSQIPISIKKLDDDEFLSLKKAITEDIKRSASISKKRNNFLVSLINIVKEALSSSNS